MDFPYFNRLYKLLTTAVFVLVLFTNSVQAETSLDGFGSVFAGRVLDGNEFLADYPKAGVYDRDWSISPDSTFGVQFSSFFTNEFSLVTQVVINGASKISADVDWLYLNYQITPELSVQLGRKRLPLYYYSDYFDLGYAYNWIRPPADLYTWEITNYNGVSLLVEKNLGEMDAKVNFYYGNEESENNELLCLLFAVPMDVIWKNMFGIDGAVSNEWLDMRISYMYGLVDRYRNGVQDIFEAEQEFVGFSINLTLAEFQILSEFNKYKRPANEVDVDTYMLSLAYQLGDFTPHLTRSDFEQGFNSAGYDEKHNTTSLGIRWDFYTDLAFKVQYDKVVDEGAAGIGRIKGSSKSISLGLDFVF